MNQEIRALCNRLWGAWCCDKNLLHYISNKYLQSSCEVFCIWAHVSEKTTTYLNVTNNFYEDEIYESTILPTLSFLMRLLT
eukprot:8211835-Ditylum_brightwellii.AAC.1